ncbi:hypothetical protein E4U60_001904 [Claviceps pazoutovae]|uniref:Uncharacterized protein n=1 Tax=Claviceps pazoutovae TaxID=1649127 RepID=A0A9P7MC22_9HYPO|nr:hypothetical protein E4U60_001904 [Claviceps pazoutovae]
MKVWEEAVQQKMVVKWKNYRHASMSMNAGVEVREVGDSAFFLAGRGTVGVGMKKNGLDDDAGRGAQENLQTADCSVVWLGGDAMCSSATVSATKVVRSTT